MTHKDKLNDFKNLDFRLAESSSEKFKRLFWEERESLTITLIVSSILLVFFVHPILVLPLAAYYIYFKNEAQVDFFKEFTEKNKLDYQRTGDASDMVGNLFKIGHSKSVENLIEGFYGERKARFFYYSYSTNEYRYFSHYGAIYNFTVLEVFFDGINLPDMLLRPKKKRKSIDPRLRRQGDNERKMNLESEFSHYYNLFFHDGYGIEATQIFSKDFLRFLVKQKYIFNIELRENRLYVYEKSRIRSIEKLSSLFQVTERVVENIEPVLKRLNKDFVVLDQFYRKK